MPKFRKKPVLVDAVQWWPPGHSQHVPIEGVEKGPREDQPYGIPTLEGFMVTSPGDWIITGVKGERYPCKHDIFVATYEEVREPVELSVNTGQLASMPEREKQDHQASPAAYLAKTHHGECPDPREIPGLGEGIDIFSRIITSWNDEDLEADAMP